jgi:hypothetical protein
MKNSFEICKILPTGIPVVVQRTEGLEKAVITAFHSAIDLRGHYTVCSGQNTSEPILDLNDFESRQCEEGNACLTFTRN